MELYEKLVNLRKEKGLSQVEVAEELHVSRQSVSKWETGISVPSTDNLICLSQLFGVPMDHFFNDSEDETITADGCSGEAERSVITDNSKRKKGWNMAQMILCICALLLVATISMYIGVTWGEKEEEHVIPVEEIAPQDIFLEGDFSIDW